jgi:cell division inhibitor SepF
VSVWHNIKVRLGLEDDWDEEYGDEYYDDEIDDGLEDDDYVGSSAYESPHGSSSSAVRKVNRQPDLARARDAGRGRGEELRSVPAGAEVSQMTPQVKMHIVEPKSYSEAQTIADRFKQGTPVIMNLSMTPPDVSKRMIDFASGLTYGLDGGLQRVSDRVFMLTPANVDVSAGEMRRLKDTGLFTLE